MDESGVTVNHATLNHWVIRYSPAIFLEAKSKKRKSSQSWRRMDETYIKVKGQWVYCIQSR